MTTELVRLSAFFPATPERIYDAWLDGGLHTRMTGGLASVDARVGGRHSAWDGYIEGEIVELEPGQRFVQTWRSTDFPADSASSRLEVNLVPDSGGTRVELLHSEIPEGQGAMYRSGWYDHYFTPMKAYFAGASAPSEPAGDGTDSEAIAEKRPAASSASAPKRKALPAKKKAAKGAAAKRSAGAAARKPKRKASPKRGGAKKRAVSAKRATSSKRGGAKRAAAPKGKGTKAKRAAPAKRRAGVKPAKRKAKPTKRGKR